MALKTIQLHFHTNSQQQRLLALKRPKNLEIQKRPTTAHLTKTEITYLDRRQSDEHIKKSNKIKNPTLSIITSIYTIFSRSTITTIIYTCIYPVAPPRACVERYTRNRAIEEETGLKGNILAQHIPVYYIYLSGNKTLSRSREYQYQQQQTTTRTQIRKISVAFPTEIPLVYISLTSTITRRNTTTRDQPLVFTRWNWIGIAGVMRR
ncbi:hypothetical protein F4819DRAFT_349400 [Hypoxylon fuscum]|nr:hypothetical protein F4819DRAFT_349400 [Hypoxylon fuscum]